tara:strand:- start:386 stop:643 length:258 start_codon:yes stop_codon:yes gene_type:complete
MGRSDFGFDLFERCLPWLIRSCSPSQLLALVLKVEGVCWSIHTLIDSVSLAGPPASGNNHLALSPDRSSFGSETYLSSLLSMHTV